jgi:hypothetical protein
LVAGLPAPNFGAKLVNDIDGSGAQRSVTKTKTDGFDAAKKKNKHKEEKM